MEKTNFDKKWIAVGFIILVSSVIYYNSLNTPFIFDDLPKIVDNSDIKQLKNCLTKLVYPYNKKHKIYERNDPSRPLTYLTFALNYHFGKLDTFGYHLFNILLHTFNAILFFFLTRKIIFYIYKKDSILFSLLVALFFAAHPINTEVTTYIYHRSESLATFFYLLSLLFFIETYDPSISLRVKRKYFYVFSLLCFILAFFSKQTAVTLPAIILTFDYMFLCDFDLGKVIKKKYYHLSFWVILVGFLLFRRFYLGEIGDTEIPAYVRWTNYSYFIIQPYVILRYLQLLVIPSGFCIDHLILPAKTVFEFKILASFFLITGLLVLVYKVYRNKNNLSKIVLFSAIWFFITLLPTSSFLPILDAMAERRIYLPGFGFYLTIVSLYFLIFRISPVKNDSTYLQVSKISSNGLHWGLFILIGVHISILGISTVKRNRLYQNPVQLWQDIIYRYPESFRARHILGDLYHEQKEYVKAIHEYQKALEMHPGSYRLHIDIGNVYKSQKKYTRAIQEYQKALKINPDLYRVQKVRRDGQK